MRPIDIAYDEHALALPANKVPEKIAGLWNYVEIIDTDDVTNAQEVSFNGGNSWTRLRKGIIVPIGYSRESREYEGTTELQFRNPTGGAVNIVVAVGNGAFLDSRLLIDATQGVVPVTVSQPLLGDGHVPVAVAGQRTVPVPGSAGLTYASAIGAAAGVVSTTLVAAGANLSGIRLHAGAMFTCIEGAGPAWCILLAKIGAAFSRVAGVRSSGGGVAFGNHVTTEDIIIPAGCDLVLKTGWDWAYDFNYTVL